MKSENGELFSIHFAWVDHASNLVIVGATGFAGRLSGEKGGEENTSRASCKEMRWSHAQVHFHCRLCSHPAVPSYLSRLVLVLAPLTGMCMIHGS